MTDRITENDPSPSPVVVVEEEESLEEEESTKQYDGLSKQNPIVRYGSSVPGWVMDYISNLICMIL